VKILVSTSDKYSFLLEPFSILFNKYWPGNEIVFLGFDEKQVPTLPPNCSFHSLGTQSDFGSIWSDPLIPYIEALQDEYFVFTMEDVMLIGAVDKLKMQILEDEIKNKRAHKALLDSHLNNQAAAHKPGLLQLNQHANYRTTLHPSIWRKEYFLNFLKPGYTAWDFEIKNMTESKEDGATIISLDQEEFLYKSSNVYKKGEPFPRWSQPLVWGSTSGIRKEDINLIYSYIDPSYKEILNNILKEDKLYH